MRWGAKRRPHTIGPTVHLKEFSALAEFGVVFLLFTIGLNYSLPQLHALRHQVLGLGTAQVLLSTALVALLLWLAGLPAAAAFVIGEQLLLTQGRRARLPEAAREAGKPFTQ